MNESNDKESSEELYIEPEVEEEPKVTIEEPVVEEQPKKYKPKGATVDIFNLNPNDPQSITARSPAIKHKN